MKCDASLQSVLANMYAMFFIIFCFPNWGPLVLKGILVIAVSSLPMGIAGSTNIYVI